jgi:hypothetical protein
MSARSNLGRLGRKEVSSAKSSTKVLALLILRGSECRLNTAFPVRIIPESAHTCPSSYRLHAAKHFIGERGHGIDVGRRGTTRECSLSFMSANDDATIVASGEADPSPLSSVPKTSADTRARK